METETRLSLRALHFFLNALLMFVENLQSMEGQLSEEMQGHVNVLCQSLNVGARATPICRAWHNWDAQNRPDDPPYWINRRVQGRLMQQADAFRHSSSRSRIRSRSRDRGAGPSQPQFPPPPPPVPVVPPVKAPPVIPPRRVANPAPCCSDKTEMPVDPGPGTAEETQRPADPRPAPDTAGLHLARLRRLEGLRILHLACLRRLQGLRILHLARLRRLEGSAPGTPEEWPLEPDLGPGLPEEAQGPADRPAPRL